MAEPLFKTKLFVPRARPGSVARPRLFALLDRGLGRKLTLVSAPAGSGKTTLVSEWCGSRGLPLAWVSLEESENDVARFWLYVAHALDPLLPGLAAELSGLLTGPQTAPAEAVVRELVNVLADLPGDAALVLDDYHAITSPDVHRTVALLLEHVPPQFHLVIATRVDPPLPLTRLRVRGELAELHMGDLRFTPEEAAAFLTSAVKRPLTERQVALLEDRTEGWIAGLQLAALSMEGLTDVNGFVEAFAGSHRYVVDYLIEEVLSHQPEQVQRFLMETAVLDRLSGPLCNVITGESGSQALLEDLERRNLFLVALDPGRQWFRYHHLFAEVLRARLAQERPGEPARLHQRASRWYEESGLFEPAVNHALAAADHERALRLMTAVADQIWHQGQNGILLRWLEALPNELMLAHPEFLFTLAWACMTSGRLEQAEAMLRTAEGRLAAEDRTALLGRVLASRAHVARLQRNLPAAVALSDRALALLPEADPTWRGMALWNLGAIHQWCGMAAAALDRYTEAQQLFACAGDLYGLLRATAWKSELLADNGRLPEAVRETEDALAQARAAGGELPMLSIAHVALGELCYERYELAEAERHLQRAVDLSRSAGLLDVTWLAYVPLALVKQAQGAARAALACLQAADELVPRIPWALAHGAAARARLLLARGDREQAFSLAPQLEVQVRDPHAPMQQAILTLAVLKLEQGFPEEALTCLSLLESHVRMPGGEPASIRYLALRAVLLQACGNATGAQGALDQALGLAGPSGNVAAFLELGPPMLRLLARAAAAGNAHARRLLDLAEGPRPAAGLVEPPSQRELEVLALVAEGASNEEIARRLFITLHTAKKHVANLLGKLEAANRTQAVARARELGLLRVK